MSAPPALTVRQLGLTDYQSAWQDMQAFTDNRNENTPDELWFLEHPPVFTLGRNGKQQHLHHTGDIPVIRADRGGQVTYHGPGQLIIYLMIDIKRRSLGVRKLVTLIEKSIIDTLQEYQLSGSAKKAAPGVYIGNAKIAALGLRIRKGCSFHGLSLNIDMNLAPFKQINPCGYKNLEVIQLSDYIESIELSQVQRQLTAHLVKNLGYEKYSNDGSLENL